MLGPSLYSALALLSVKKVSGPSYHFDTEGFAIGSVENMLDSHGAAKENALAKAVSSI